MILVTGATGFLGSHLVKKLAEEKMEICCLIRPSSDTSHIQKYGVDIRDGDVSDPGSLREATAGVETIVHLVGIIRETPGVTFERIHSLGARNLVEAAAENGVGKFVYVSALGAAPYASTRYHRTKWEAEDAVRRSGIEYTILRPSVIFGEGDGFVNTLADLIKKSPVVPVIGGGRYRLQPIGVDAVVSAIAQSIPLGTAAGKTIEMGGPDRLEFIEILDIITGALGVKRRKVKIPTTITRLSAKLMESVLSNPPVTVEEISMLLQESICDDGLMLQTFDLQTVHLRDGIKEYLR